MGLEAAVSRPAQLDHRIVILRGALLSRRSELQRSWKHLISADCLEHLGPIAPGVEALLSGREKEAHGWTLPDRFAWLRSDIDFWDCLQAVALARRVEWRPADTSPPHFYLGSLKQLVGPEGFKFLCARYRCPLNIAAPSEHEIAEELLRRLMVIDRAKIEAGGQFDAEGVLLRLNLVGIRAMVACDLRSLDALNYFYELPRRSLIPLRVNPRLLAFWLCIYVQLLSKPDWLKCE